MRAPLAAIAAAFALGIGLFWWIRPAPSLLLCGIGALAGIAVWARNRPWAANLCLIGLAVALGLFRAWVDGQIPSNSVGRWLTATYRPIRCEGIFESDVEWFQPAQGQAWPQGWLKVTGIQQPAGWVPISGRLLIRLPTLGAGLAYGDRVRLYGAARRPRPREVSPPRTEIRPVQSTIPPLQSSAFDEEHWFWKQGGCGIVSVSEVEGITRLKSPAGFWVRYRRWVTSLRWRLKSMGRSLLGPQEAAYLEALLLGEAREIPRELWEAFRRTGTVHVLVVSGLHVGLIGTIGFLLLSLLRVARALRYLALAGILVTYCLLTGSHPPILRATIMGILLCLGRIRGVGVPALNSVGCAALLFLAADPRALADASFQLSFAAVFGLLVLSPRLMKGFKVCGSWFRDPSFGHEPSAENDRLLSRMKRWTAQGLAASCGAWVGVCPFVAWHFHMVTPIALLANLLIVPWACGLLLVGFLLYGVGGFSPWMASPVAESFTSMARGLTHWVTRIALLPGASWSW